MKQVCCCLMTQFVNHIYMGHFLKAKLAAIKTRLFLPPFKELGILQLLENVFI